MHLREYKLVETTKSRNVSISAVCMHTASIHGFAFSLTLSFFLTLTLSRSSHDWWRNTWLWWSRSPQLFSLSLSFAKHSRCCYWQKSRSLRASTSVFSAIAQSLQTSAAKIQSDGSVRPAKHHMMTFAWRCEYKKPTTMRLKVYSS